LLLLARLGLRAREVAALELEDVDWRRGEILLHGKGGRQDRLPLPNDVGEAIVSYLRRRPRQQSRALFVRVIAPSGALEQPMTAKSRGSLHGVGARGMTLALGEWVDGRLVSGLVRLALSAGALAHVPCST
jgi:integrase